MRKLRLPVSILLLLLLLAGCSPKEEYFSREEALKNGYVVLDGTNSENSDRFEMFLNNVDAKREDAVMIVIYDLTESQYIIDIRYDGNLFTASRHFMDKESRKTQEMENLTFTHISKTSSKNYFLVDENQINAELWIYQGK
jgi:hypothetical protein